MNEPARQRDTILVVDDTPDTLGFLTDALEHANLTVLVATDGASAIKLLSHVTPDLILMDAVMPGMDGFETCSRIKADSALAHLPVIFMTGLSDTQHVVRGLEAGGVDYVAKPIVVEELLARIRVHLANARSANRTRIALDATGRFLLAATQDGRLIWCTPQAEKRLASSIPDFTASGFVLPQSRSIDANGRQLVFTFLSCTGPDEYLYRLTESGGGQEEAFIRQRLSLTTREAEVLIWIARGKSNRDISDILGISPRTVNKHLEQIFTKLGVENRASAAALAVAALATRV
ncbi:MAG: DNA-binding response regulator [Acidocella sp. 20-57-95]|nr:MAG: DNA-binding response regulator [Acidocella sp. 20-57-95]OYV58560.1 MAG: DNA-binding response regulator [Acidocella sp. 21-58-7]HQT64769.1 response regulator transcription factor [Acidocella sp.]HQU03716.1 response regulator transcription factor [Acidocella sp.]